MLKYKYKPQLSKKAFWDTDFEKLDYEQDAEYIIKAVFNYGTLDDVMEVLICYGEEAVKNTLVKAHYLDGWGRDMACAIFNLKPTDLACCTKKPFHQTF
jgi:hypothetical protein